MKKEKYSKRDKAKMAKHKHKRVHKQIDQWLIALQFDVANLQGRVAELESDNG